MPKLEKREVVVEGDPVSIRIVGVPAGVTPRGTAFVPPLIGGSGLQQVGYFRTLNRSGYALATFDYRGHGKSGGRFRVARALADARHVLDELVDHPGSRPPGPLVGVADCFGCIPLLRCAVARPSAFTGLVLFNPVPSLQHVAGPGEVLANWFGPRDANGRRRWRLRNPLDLRGMLLATNQTLFPAVDKSRDHFGILAYERADTWWTTGEYLFSRPLRDLVSGLPAEIWFGRSDALLGIGEPDAEERYRALWRSHLPNATVHVFEEADHFWTGVQAQASAVAARFFERLGDDAPRPAARQREPGDALERNHQLSGLTTSSGL